MQNVRTALKRFEKIRISNKQTNKQNRLITIVNWEVYQSKDVDLTKEVTSNSQATNKQLTTNKNYKNDKNEKNIKDITSGETQKARFTQTTTLIKFLQNSFQINQKEPRHQKNRTWMIGRIQFA